MSRWYRVYMDMLNAPSVQLLPDAEFRQKFMAALSGEQNEFSEFVVLDPQCGRLSASEWSVIRSKIFARDDYTCVYCGAKGAKLQCDHVFPVARGGGNSEQNLVTACEPCNRAKRSRIVSIDEWRAVRRKGAA